MSYVLASPDNFHKRALHSNGDVDTSNVHTAQMSTCIGGQNSKVSCSNTDNFATLSAKSGNVESKQNLL